MSELSFPPSADRADIFSHRGPQFRAPIDLRRTSALALKTLVIGACTAYGAAGHMRDCFGWQADHILFNGVAELPPKSDDEIATYSFQFVQLSYRSVSPEQFFLNTNMDDETAAQAYFEVCCDRMLQMLDAALTYNRQTGLLTFVANFPAPQQNLLGRLLPRYELRNPVYFVEQLNRRLIEQFPLYSNVYLADYDQVCAGSGRMYAQDDSVCALSHSSLLTDFDYDHDRNRIVPPGRIHDYYDLRTGETVNALLHELEAMYRTARQIDAVKLVIVDLDDTLWRGVYAEGEKGTQEGWPLGFSEALAFLKRRGIVLAIVSKNDEAPIRENWGDLTWGLLPFESFAVHRINWRPKPQNVAEIIAEVNVLPESVVFIDDNPAERAAVSAAFPGIRLLGADPYYLRRILLWAPELQVTAISQESSQRTEMIRGHVDRNAQRERMSRADFLASLELRLDASEITSDDHPKAPRAFELLNKTNQFNTTGLRWSETQWKQLFRSGGKVFAFDVSDRFSAYGLTCVALIEKSGLLQAGRPVVAQFVMSCRVIGLDVEVQALEVICARLRQDGAKSVAGRLEPTGKNQLSLDLFAKSGFQESGDSWVKPL